MNFDRWILWPGLRRLGSTIALAGFVLVGGAFEAGAEEPSPAEKVPAPVDPVAPDAPTPPDSKLVDDETERLLGELINQLPKRNQAAPPESGPTPINPPVNARINPQGADPLFEFPSEPFVPGLKMGGNIATHGVVEELFVRAGVASLPQPEVGRELQRQSQMAEAIGRKSHALKLLKQAQQHLPGDAAVAKEVRRLEEQVAVSRQQGATRSRIKARLASAVQHADRLIGANQHAEAGDLLRGVIEAAGVVDSPSEVELYRKAAESRLAQHAAAMAKTPAKLPAATESPGEKPASAAQAGEGLAKKMSVDYGGTMFGIVVDQIAAATSVPLTIDSSLIDAKVTPLHTIRLQREETAAAEILLLACQQAGVVVIEGPGGLLITTPYRAERQFSRVPLDLAGLVQSAPLSTGLKTPARSAAPAAQNSTVPAHLQSGASLVEEVRSLSK